MARPTFISPTVDYAFKKIFGSDKSEDILLSFLNAIIYNGESVISSLTIINPYNPGQVNKLKDSYLDVRAVLRSGEIVLIEMQMARVQGFHKRVIYNMCKSYANQLDEGEFYLGITPVIAVTVTDFILFKENKLIHHFVFREKEGKKTEYPQHELQMLFVELPRFKKELKSLTTLAEKWIYFIKHASELTEVPPSLEEVAEIDKALKIAKLVNMDPEEAEAVISRAISLQDEIGKIKYANEEGREEGRIIEARALVMRQLKKRFGQITEEINSSVESLSLLDLERLTEDIFDFNSTEDLLNWLSEVESR